MEIKNYKNRIFTEMMSVKSIDYFNNPSIFLWNVIFGDKLTPFNENTLSYNLYKDTELLWFGVDIIKDAFFTQYKIPDFNFEINKKYELSLFDMHYWKKRDINTHIEFESNLTMEVVLIDQNETHLLCKYIDHKSEKVFSKKEKFDYYIIPKSYAVEIDGILYPRKKIVLDESILHHDEYSEKFCEYFIEGIENKNHVNKSSVLNKTNELIKPLFYSFGIQALGILLKHKNDEINFDNYVYYRALYIKLKKLFK